MIDYNPERKRIDNAIEKIKKDFVQKRKEIIETDLSESEQQEKLAELLSETEAIEDILTNVRSIDEISEEDREILGIDTNIVKTEVDEELVNTLVQIYAKRARTSKKKQNLGFSLDDREYPEEDIDIRKFETELTKYFTEHYSDLFEAGYNHFLSDFAKQKDADGLINDKNGELVEILQKCNIEPEKFKCFGYTITVQDGLVSEEENISGRLKVHYATSKGINDRINNIYNDIVYREAQSTDKFFMDEKRNLKNNYLEYAKKNEIEVENKDVFEEIPIDNNKVQAIAKYINRVLNERNEVEISDNTQLFADEITKNYSKIMNLQWYDFNDLESVKKILGEKLFVDSLHLRLEEDNITRPDEFRPDIAYGTPEYLKTRYKSVMEKVESLHSSNAFIESKIDVEKANKEKQALRRYIKENGIKGIDISVPQVEINHDMINMIADSLMEYYGENYEDKEIMKTRILSKLEDNWSEIITECQCVDVNDLFKEEVKEMGHEYADETLYVKNDFVCLGDFSHFHDKIIYATPEAIRNNISALDIKIASRDICSEEENARNNLEQYAKEQEFNLNIPNIETVKNRRRQEKEMFSFGGRELFGMESMPDDPTARSKIEFNDTIMNVIVKISEGVPGAIVGATSLLKADETGFMLLLGLDDMNIRGSQIWEAYKYLYNEDGEKFAKAVSRRDPKMVDFINEELAAVGEEKAVTGGASFDRHKTPDKYRFTEEEVEQLKVQREERIAKQKEQWEKMLANSPAKKHRGAKKRQEREEKKKAYRQKLIAKGKKSLEELDEELTDLQEKEKQAKELCTQYEEQLPDKNQQEL